MHRHSRWLWLVCKVCRELQHAWPPKDHKQSWPVSELHATRDCILLYAIPSGRGQLIPAHSDFWDLKQESVLGSPPRRDPVSSKFCLQRKLSWDRLTNDPNQPSRWVVCHASHSSGEWQVYRTKADIEKLRQVELWAIRDVIWDK